MADIQFTAGRGVEGFLASVIRRDSDRAAHIFVRSNLFSSSALGESINNFATALEGRTGDFNNRSERFTDQGFRESITNTELRPVSVPYRNLRDVAVKRANELRAMKADFATPRFPDNDGHAKLREELRNRIFATKAAHSFDAATRSFEMAVAIAEGGEALAMASGWTPDLWSRFIDDFAERNLAHRLSGQFRLGATVADLLRDGPDYDKARAAARAHLAAHQQSLAEVDAVGDVLTSTIDFIALTLDSHREAAFEMLMAA